MDIVDYGDYVIYGYSGLCIQWIAGIMWIMCTLDHVDCVCRTTECFSFHPLLFLCVCLILHEIHRDQPISKY